MTGADVLAPPWPARRARTEALRERYPFARGPLTLYLALLDAQEPAWEAARRDAPVPAELPGYVAERAMPAVMAATAAAGPEALAETVRERFAGAALDRLADVVRRWLRDDEQTPVERYLARAAAGPVLEALGASASDACAGPRDDRHCPVCGGLPQLSYFAPTAESLVSGRRSLVCARCSATWPCARVGCAACGEQDGAKITVLSEEGTSERDLSGTVVRGLRGRAPQIGPGPRFPHVRIDACGSCSRYLLSIDLTRDPRAVPIVDECAAIPLDLYAVERGFTKVVPNLMGV